MYRHILVPTDGSELSRGAIRQAANLAQGTDARITVFYVQPECPQPTGGETLLLSPYRDEFVREAAATANRIFAESKADVEAQGVNCECRTATSNKPWQEIIDAATAGHCDLIFMASHGRSGLSGLLVGSQTQKVLTHCRIPVLVCR